MLCAAGRYAAYTRPRHAVSGSSTLAILLMGPCVLARIDPLCFAAARAVNPEFSTEPDFEPREIAIVRRSKGKPPSRRSKSEVHRCRNERVRPLQMCHAPESGSSGKDGRIHDLAPSLIGTRVPLPAADEGHQESCRSVQKRARTAAPKVRRGGFKCKAKSRSNP